MSSEENIEIDSSITIPLPRIIEAQDYHDFKFYENILKHDFGVENIVIEEIGYEDGSYIGLAHLDTPEHQNLARELEIRYREQFDQEPE